MDFCQRARGRLRQAILGLTLVGTLGAAAAGPVLIDGTDANDHGFADAAGNQEGWRYMQDVLEALASQLNSSVSKNLVVLGTTEGTEARESIQSAFDLSALASDGWAITYVVGADAISSWLSGISTDNTGILYLGTHNLTEEDLTDDEAQALGAHGADIARFIDGLGGTTGGGLFAMGQTGAHAYDWLDAILPGVTANLASVLETDPETGITPVDANVQMAFPSLDGNAWDVGRWHVYFENAGELLTLGEGLFDDERKTVILGAGASRITPPPTGEVPEPGALALIAAALLAGWTLRCAGAKRRDH
jgi:hypothetical protein